MLLALGNGLDFWQSSAQKEFSRRLCFFFWSHGKFVAEVPGVGGRRLGFWSRSRFTNSDLLLVSIPMRWRDGSLLFSFSGGGVVQLWRWKSWLSSVSWRFWCLVFEVKQAPEVYSDSKVPREPGYGGGDGNSALFRVGKNEQLGGGRVWPSNCCSVDIHRCRSLLFRLSLVHWYLTTVIFPVVVWLFSFYLILLRQRGLSSHRNRFSVLNLLQVMAVGSIAWCSHLVLSHVPVLMGPAWLSLVVWWQSCAGLKTLLLRNWYSFQACIWFYGRHWRGRNS